MEMIQVMRATARNCFVQLFLFFQEREPSPSKLQNPNSTTIVAAYDCLGTL